MTPKFKKGDFISRLDCYDIMFILNIDIKSQNYDILQLENSYNIPEMRTTNYDFLYVHKFYKLVDSPEELKAKYL